jgi:hypothetical protein
MGTHQTCCILILSLFSTKKDHKMPFITSIISDFNYINENLIQLVMCSIIRSYLIINLKL